MPPYFRKISGIRGPRIFLRQFRQPLATLSVVDVLLRNNLPLFAKSCAAGPLHRGRYTIPFRFKWPGWRLPKPSAFPSGGLLRNGFFQFLPPKRRRYPLQTRKFPIFLAHLYVLFRLYE
jgi:hypothetical protein